MRDRSPFATIPGIEAGAKIGRYECVRIAGEGGMARVWLARATAANGFDGFHESVALKEPLPVLAQDPEFRAQFLEEARIACAIQHPNVVQVLDLGEEAGVPYLVMEWVDGVSLQVLARQGWRRGSFPLPIALRIIGDLLAGLHAAHEQRDARGNVLDVVHRDVTPHNVLIARNGFAKIADFGIAKAVGRVSAPTALGTFKGKVEFAAPEQASGGKVDRRADLYSVAVILFQLTTGKHPYAGDNDAETLQRLIDGTPVPASSMAQGPYPAALERLLLKAMARAPSARFATAAEMAEALATIAKKDGLEATTADVAAYVEATIEGAKPVVADGAPAQETAPVPAVVVTTRGHRTRLRPFAVGAAIVAACAVIATAVVAKQHDAESHGGTPLAPAPVTDTMRAPSDPRAPATPDAVHAAAPPRAPASTPDAVRTAGGPRVLRPSPSSRSQATHSTR